MMLSATAASGSPEIVSRSYSPSQKLEPATALVSAASS